MVDPKSMHKLMHQRISEKSKTIGGVVEVTTIRRIDCHVSIVRKRVIRERVRTHVSINVLAHDSDVSTHVRHANV